MRKMSILILLTLPSLCQAAVEATVGNTTVFPQISIHGTRRAMPFIMPGDGTIESIAIYHQGGRGDMLLGVYIGDDAPVTRLAATLPTPVSASEGWQTALLTRPVWVPGGTQIWLAWVFEENPGVRYEVASPGWAESDGQWDEGMPSQFGAGTQANYAYSIYANYTGEAGLVINEVLLRNDALTGSGFLDEDGTKQGWIEIYNPGNLPIDLNGYYLSDSQDALQKWAFPDVAIGPGEFLLVWGSGKDRTDPAGELHTSFNIMNSESLLLTYSAAETRIDALEAMKIPVDYSYGRYPDRANTWYFYTQPTPGAANSAEEKSRFVIDQRHVSLTVGKEFRLTVTPRSEQVVWSSDNPLVWVSNTGRLLAVEDALGEEAQIVITARSTDGQYVDSCRATIVNWMANLSDLQVVETPAVDYVLATEGDALYFARGQELYVSTDGLNTSESLGALPETLNAPILLVTPFGYFLRSGATIYRSGDLVDWTVTFAMNARGLFHSFDYYWEETSQTGYLYTGEYSVDPTARHRVYRGTFSADGEERWDTVLEFTALAEWQANRSVLTAARHVHVVVVDPYTGHVWVGVGDVDEHAKILTSDDHGDSFSLVGMGNQAWRTVAIWFTPRYVYWGMDTSGPQSLWRMPRSRFEEGGFWPSVTPELTSGTTKAGVRYYVTRNETPEHFPVTKGYVYAETEARPLDGENRVRALNDSEYDYREEVAQLYNGSLWYHRWVSAEDGAPIAIVGEAAEGALRDYRGRVFGIKEMPDGSCDVQELLSVTSTAPETYVRYVQFQPKAQDADGCIYFLGRNTHHRIYKTELHWTNSP